jgi:hypothetical protein
MKKLIFIFIAVFAARAIYADEIILKDNTILKGTVIQVTDTAVEYDPEGPSAFETVAIDSVSKIIYTGGRVQIFQLDTITLTGGETIRCSIIRVTRDAVIYRMNGTGGEKTIGRDQVARLVFSDGRSVDISKKAGPVEPEETVRPPARGFNNSLFRMSLFAGGGLLNGGTIQKERHAFKAYKPDLMIANLSVSNYAQYAGFTTVGVEMEYLPPAINFPQKRGFDFTGIKFGVRGRYGHENVMSVITPDYSNGSGGGNDNLYMGKLLQYHYWTAGPVMNFIFSPRSNIVSFMISMYGMAGQVFGGDLSPATSLRDSKMLAARLAGAWSPGSIQPFMKWANLLTLGNLNKTSVRGYTIRCGFGPEVSLNRYFPIIVGVHVTYAYTSLTYGRAPLIYGDGNRKAAHHELGGEISVGVHI